LHTQVIFTGGGSSAGFFFVSNGGISSTLMLPHAPPAQCLLPLGFDLGFLPNAALALSLPVRRIGATSRSGWHIERRIRVSAA
jgi:hypothetical protein